MRAFVLSGGGNRGPLQVGALRVLLERGIRPDMIVGSSAGALNGVFLAIEPSRSSVDRLAEMWREAGRRKVIHAGPLRTIWQLLRGTDHVMENAGLAAFIRAVLPPAVRTFGDLTLPFYVTIAHWLTRTLYVYGDDPQADLTQALVTTAAVPGYFPPTWHNGEAFIDGGLVSNAPAQVAVARGATELWVIDLAYSTDVPRKVGDSLSVIRHAVYPALYRETLLELQSVALRPGIRLHHIPMYDYQDVALGDFSATEGMFELGAHAACAYLEHPEPNVVRCPRKFAVDELPPGPPGSKPFAG
ncbi:MAG: patatin-like phospholipase family protein [Anaerolineae bacterium]|nr:patatin-like phospholipase family protein [Thermoflexales bacterium]MDW8406724.1 patatin-like phospholipase family protein [Anaerolineae bacterium]